MTPADRIRTAEHWSPWDRWQERRMSWAAWDGDQCPRCGDDVEVRSDRRGIADGDAARCCRCGWSGAVLVDEDGARLEAP